MSELESLRAQNAELVATLTTLRNAVIKHGVVTDDGAEDIWLSAFTGLMDAMRRAKVTIEKAAA